MDRVEKLIGKLVQTDGVCEFVRDFLEWAGTNTAKARLELESTDMALEIICEHKADDPLLGARGLAGGGEAVGAWAESCGYHVLDSTPEFITVDADAKSMPTAADDLARFLAPKGNWRIAEANARRRP